VACHDVLLQVRKPKRPARLAALPDLTSGPSSSSSSSGTAAGLSSVTERLNASYHPNLQWPEFGYLLDSLAAAAAKGSRRCRGGAAVGVEGAATALLRGAGGPATAPVLDWVDAAAAEAADKAMMEQQQDDLTGGG
jgi:hypothetical protein